MDNSPKLDDFVIYSYDDSYIAIIIAIYMG